MVRTTTTTTTENGICPICGAPIATGEPTLAVPFNNRGGAIGYVHAACTRRGDVSYAFGEDTWGHHAGYVMRGHSPKFPKLMHLGFQLKLEGHFSDAFIAEMVKVGRNAQAPWLHVKGGVVSPTFHDLRSVGRKLPATAEGGHMTVIIKGKDFKPAVMNAIAHSGVLAGIAEFKVTAYSGDGTLRIKGECGDGYANIRKMLLLGKALAENIVRHGAALDADTVRKVCEGGECHCNYKVTKEGGVRYAL